MATGSVTTRRRGLPSDRLAVVAAIVALWLLSWAYILTGAGLGMGPLHMSGLSLFPHRHAMGMDQMAMGMQGAAAAPWELALAMWWTMMVAMMTPSAAPTILLYDRVRRHDAAGSVAPTAVFTAGYLLVWLAFSILAVAAQWVLARAGLLSPMLMGSQSRWLSAGVLLAAGLYQFLPLKQACLSRCRAPAAFLSRHWRPGAAGAVRLGALHGLYCVGCCWMLMALLYVGGVMNLAWIAMLTVLVMAEKLLPGGVWVGRAAGALLVLWGAATALG